MSFMRIVSCIHKCVVEVEWKQSCKNLHGLKISSESFFFSEKNLMVFITNLQKINDNVQQQRSTQAESYFTEDFTDRKLINSTTAQSRPWSTLG